MLFLSTLESGLNFDNLKLANYVSFKVVQPGRAKTGSTYLRHALEHVTEFAQVG